jgi:bla regulator protein blaR1
MDIHSLLNTFEAVLHEHAGLGYFVDLLLKSLFVLVLMFLINVYSRRLSASLRHLVWCVGFISLFTLPLFIGMLPKIHVPITTSESVIVENTVSIGIVNLADNVIFVLGAWWNAFLSLYFVLLFIQVSYILLGLCKIISIARASNPLENDLLCRELDNLSLEAGLAVTVSLKKSKEVYSPVSWGLFAPEIILPEQAESWDIEKTRNVLIHELSHIQRLDWLTMLIVRFTRAIYWFNPLIWYAASKLEQEAEQACDDAVILNGSCHNEYASNLLEIASQARLGHLGNTLVQAIAGSPLGSRVFSILDTSKKRQPTELDWVVRGILVGCTVIAILASLRLVPLVNVTTLDPHASTAFSVIFIPDKSANALVEAGDVEIPEILDAQEVDDSSAPSIIRAPQIQSEAQREARETEGVLAAAESTQGENEQNTSTDEDKPSLLDDFISTLDGQDTNIISFENYVNKYTSDISHNVQSDIEFRSLEEEAVDDEAAIVVIKTSPPIYPDNARRKGWEGYSVVEYAIDHQGKVTNAVIVDSKPRGVFNRSSIRAIEQYLFEPPKVNGEVVSLQGRQTKFSYQLKPG